MNRPMQEDIKKRALDIKRGAIQQLADAFGKNAELIEKYYPGYEAEDLKALIGFLPKGKAQGWRL